MFAFPDPTQGDTSSKQIGLLFLKENRLTLKLKNKVDLFQKNFYSIIISRDIVVYEFFQCPQGFLSKHNTPGTRGGPGGRDRTLAVKSRKTPEISFLAQAALHAPPEVALQCIACHYYYQFFSSSSFFRPLLLTHFGETILA